MRLALASCRMRIVPHAACHMRLMGSKQSSELHGVWAGRWALPPIPGGLLRTRLRVPLLLHYTQCSCWAGQSRNGGGQSYFPSGECVSRAGVSGSTTAITTQSPRQGAPLPEPPPPINQRVRDTAVAVLCGRQTAVGGARASGWRVAVVAGADAGDAVARLLSA
jgi:hypothetical protein